MELQGSHISDNIDWFFHKNSKQNIKFNDQIRE